HLIAAELEVPVQDVGEEEGAQVADVRRRVDGRATHVHPHPPGFQGDELLASPRQRIEEVEHVWLLRCGRPATHSCPQRNPPRMTVQNGRGGRYGRGGFAPVSSDYGRRRSSLMRQRRPSQTVPT